MWELWRRNLNEDFGQPEAKLKVIGLIRDISWPRAAQPSPNLGFW